MPFVVHCIPDPNGGAAAISPCGVVDGVGYQPFMQHTDSAIVLDFAQSFELFEWAVTLVLLFWIVGLVTGNIVRVIRSA